LHLFSPPRPNPSLLAGRLAQRKDVIADYGQRKLGYAVLLVSFGLEYVLNQEQSREFVKMAREIGADEEKSANCLGTRTASSGSPARSLV
jgi:hypothetical protein